MWTIDDAKMVGFILILLLSSQVNLRLIIMWSVPFNFNLRDSYYAIGLTHNKVPVGLPVFCNGFEISGEISKLCVLVPPDVLRDQQRIQKKSNRWKNLFTTLKLSPPRSAGRSLTFSSPLISVHGFMEANTYHSVLNISVVPRRWPCHNVTMWQCDNVTMWPCHTSCQIRMS